MAELSSFIRELQDASSLSCGSISLMHQDISSRLLFPPDEKILMLPLLIQKGGTYEKLLSCGAVTAPPLLCRRDDIMECASVINSTLEKKKDHNYILVAHGDEQRTIEEYRALVSERRCDHHCTERKRQLQNTETALCRPDSDSLPSHLRPSCKA